MNRKKLFCIGGASIAVIIVAALVAVTIWLTWPADSDESDESDSYYRAGVVEYEKIRYTNQTREALENLEKYLGILESEEARDLDIIVFPESTLNNLATAVFAPEHDEEVNVCTDESPSWDPILRKVACVARDKKLYVVINVSEKSVCPDVQQLRLKDPRPCAESGINRYNANLVFDRNGVLVSKYRKFSLFGEVGTLAPYRPEAMFFRTDFGVTFGHFICFDLMFDKPALDLVKRGITDFIFPTMWFSELPFLNAVQIQQAWAFRHNVNFLAAGASLPAVGSTGSGIYHGREGILTAIMSPKPRTQVLRASVPKVGSNARASRTPIERISPNDLLDLYLLRDQLDPYGSQPIVPGRNSQTSICVGEKVFCCHFEFQVDNLSDVPQGKKYYKYRLVAFQGARSFSGMADGGVKTCALIACTDDTHESCGRRFPKDTEVVNAITFRSLNISTSFNPRDNELFLPNTQDNSFIPFESEYFDYREENKSPTETEVTMRLLREVSDVTTFAIYGRDFSLDSERP